MEFFCYHRDRPGSMTRRLELVEAHWSYMDRYERELIARGPTLSPDGETATGSVHIVDLRDPLAARAFAFDEPNYQAGIYRDVLVRRWVNRLGRTMWEYPRGLTDANRFLVLGLAEGTAADQAPDTTLPRNTDALIAYGPMLSDDEATWLGTAVLLEAEDAASAARILDATEYAAVEVHNWDYGGRSD